MVALIGGIETASGLRHDVVLRPLSGAAELVLSELAALPLNQPEKVSRFLSETVAEVGGQPCTEECASALSVGDRQHLVRQVAAAMGHDRVWLSGRCQRCEEEFDLPVEPSRLPVKCAGEGYPSVTVEIAGNALSLRSPTGADQAAIADVPEAEARLILLRRLSGLAKESALAAEQAAQIESEIEALSPEVALEVASACPACADEMRIRVDPYLALIQTEGDILEDIHTLASTYHWSEESILSLPRTRRKQYLRMIDRARGMVAQAPPQDGFH